MIKKVIRITLVVRDQDKALQWYIEELGFQKRADVQMRRARIAPREQKELEIVLASPKWYDGKGSEALIGKATTTVLETDDCKADYENLVKRGVDFIGLPKDEMYGISAVFLDLYGNAWNLLQPKRQ